jgi:hypothetical protein
MKAVVCALAVTLAISIPVTGVAEQRSFTVEYVAPTSPSLQEMAATLKSERILQPFADTFDEYFELPKSVRISLAECNAVNAFYDHDSRRITLCYELVLDLAKRFAGRPQSDDLFSGTLIFIASHELGHALIDVLELPVLGREEDAADQLAALAMLEDSEGVRGVVSSAVWFASNAGSNDRVALPAMADEHALDEQRYFNMLCWAYGANPEGNQDLIAKGVLPATRAEQCPHEYQQLKKSWYQLLGKHLKKRFDAPEEGTNKAGGTTPSGPPPTVAETLGTVAGQESAPPVKKSRSGICYEAGTGRYNQTEHFEPFASLEDCINSGGRLPR